MYWDSRPQYDCPAISNSSVSWTDPDCFDVVAAKADVAGYVCRREMTDSPNDKIAIEKDLEHCRKRFDKHIGGDDEAFKKFVAEAERLLLEDLKSPQVREEIWEEAKRFEMEVFPTRQATWVGRLLNSKLHAWGWAAREFDRWVLMANRN